MLVPLVVTSVSIADNVQMNKTYLEKVAEQIKKLRTEKGLTQDDLGTNGISRQMVSLLELAKTDITVSKLKVLADNMGIKVKDIFDFE